MVRRISHAIYLVCILAILAIWLMPNAHAQMKEASELSSKIDVAKAEYKGTEPLIIRFTLTNKSDSTLNVLKWQTPLEGFTANIFQVKRDGKPVQYIGRTVKRAAPQPQDYVKIGAGESVSVDVDLAQAYGIYDTGDYSVESKSRLLDFGHAAPAELAAKATLEPKLIRSNVVSFKLLEKRERPPIPPAELKEEAGAKEPSFKGCSQSQQNAITTAHSNAQNYSSGSWILLSGVSVANRPQCERYSYWFGTYDASRWNTVTNHFSAIYNAFANQTVTYNCNCNENYYAYVYPSKPYEIYLCNIFWSAPATGTDSQFGTLIHEMSHFYVVAGTDDHVYGQTGAHNLALNNPANAIDNADNHEYFAENTPARKCGGDYTVYSLLLIPLVVLAVWFVRQRRRVLS